MRESVTFSNCKYCEQPLKIYFCFDNIILNYYNTKNNGID